MERDFRTYLRLLSCASVLAALCLTAPTPAKAAANLEVRVEIGECGKTSLRLTLRGAWLRPNTAFLEIYSYAGISGWTAVARDQVNLEWGTQQYLWAGSLRLAQYKVVLYNSPNKVRRLGEGDFGNVFLGRRFLGPRTPAVRVKSRGNGPRSAQEKTVYEVANIQVPPEVVVMQILLFNERDELAAQYLGGPISSWRSQPLSPGNYKRVIVGYSRDQCRVVYID